METDKNRRHFGIFLGLSGLIIFFLSIGKINKITGAVVGTENTANFGIFFILGIVLIAVSLIIEFQERKTKKKR